MHKKHVKRNERSSAENSAIKMRSINKAEEFLLFWTAGVRGEFCRDKHTFVATKIILVAAPVNDTSDVS